MASTQFEAWALWLVDCLLRLLAVSLTVWLSMAVVAMFIGGGGGGWNPIGFAVGAYLGTTVSTAVYLPLLMVVSRVVRWRAAALLLSPIPATGGFLVVLPWFVADLSGAILLGAVIGIGFGAVVAAPRRQTLRSVSTLVAASLALVMAMFSVAAVG